MDTQLAIELVAPLGYLAMLLAVPRHGDDFPVPRAIRGVGVVVGDVLAFTRRRMESRGRDYPGGRPDDDYAIAATVVGARLLPWRRMAQRRSARRWRGILVVAALLGASVVSTAGADVVLLLGESYGKFGTFSPTGHAAVYLTRVCAESPSALRRCRPGEMGAVISRYHRVAGLDWVAIPVIPYLYAVERAADVPLSASRDDVSTLRDRYRRTWLIDVAPDGEFGATASGDWVQLVGAAYDRRLIGFSVATTPAQDDDLIALLNREPNRVRFNLLTRNCANFARDIVNLFHVRAIGSSLMADLGFTTPKQIAKALTRYGTQRPAVKFFAFVVPQIPGSRRSRDARGVLESLVKTKKYAVPLVLAQPVVPMGLAAGYLIGGRFRPLKLVEAAWGPEEIERRAVAVSAQ